AKMPDEVRARIDKIFEDLAKRVAITPMDEEQAQQEAFRVASRINWTRAVHRSLQLDLADSRYMTVSKVMAQWTLIDPKLNPSNRTRAEMGQKTRQVPDTAIEQPEDDEHEEKIADAETA